MWKETKKTIWPEIEFMIYTYDKICMLLISIHILTLISLQLLLTQQIEDDDGIIQSINTGNSIFVSTDAK